jgi:hypothetical protein
MMAAANRYQGEFGSLSSDRADQPITRHDRQTALSTSQVSSTIRIDGT